MNHRSDSFAELKVSGLSGSNAFLVLHHCLVSIQSNQQNPDLIFFVHLMTWCHVARARAPFKTFGVRHRFNNMIAPEQECYSSVEEKRKNFFVAPEQQSLTPSFHYCDGRARQHEPLLFLALTLHLHAGKRAHSNTLHTSKKAHSQDTSLLGVLTLVPA